MAETAGVPLAKGAGDAEADEMCITHGGGRESWTAEREAGWRLMRVQVECE